jgi:hypothetical protein
MSQEPEVFSTRDIYLAATLITLKFQMISVDYQFEGAREMPVGYFQFEKSEELMSAEQGYWRGSLSVEPRAFVTNMRGLKAQTSNSLKSPHSTQLKK